MTTKAPYENGIVFHGFPECSHCDQGRHYEYPCRLVRQLCAQAKQTGTPESASGNFPLPRTVNRKTSKLEIPGTTHDIVTLSKRDPLKICYIGAQHGPHMTVSP